MVQQMHFVQTKAVDEKPVIKKEDKYIDIKICNGTDLIGLDMQNINVSPHMWIFSCQEMRE